MTSSSCPPPSRAGLPLRLMRAIEDASALDRVVAAEQPVADLLLRSARRRRLLQGEPLGHALHPPLTDLPIGLWLSSGILDLAGRRYARGADLLLTLGVLSATPAALTGLADWGTARRETQRVGVVHAAANSSGLVLYVTSLVLRRRQRRRGAVVLSLLAGACVGAGGLLGGHLAVLQGHGPRTDESAG